MSDFYQANGSKNEEYIFLGKTGLRRSFHQDRQFSRNYLNPDNYNEPPVVVERVMPTPNSELSVWEKEKCSLLVM